MPRARDFVDPTQRETERVSSVRMVNEYFGGVHGRAAHHLGAPFFCVIECYYSTSRATHVIAIGELSRERARHKSHDWPRHIHTSILPMAIPDGPGNPLAHLWVRRIVSPSPDCGVLAAFTADTSTIRPSDPLEILIIETTGTLSAISQALRPASVPTSAVCVRSPLRWLAESGMRPSPRQRGCSWRSRFMSAITTWNGKPTRWPSC